MKKEGDSLGIMRPPGSWEMGEGRENKITKNILVKTEGFRERVAVEASSGRKKPRKLEGRSTDLDARTAWAATLSREIPGKTHEI